MKKRSFSLLLFLILCVFCVCQIPMTASADTVSYDLWIGGVQVTDDNLIIDSKDLPGVTGTAAYDPAEQTLTLQDFVFSGQGADGSLVGDPTLGRAAILIGGDWLFIDVQGVCSLTEAGGSGVASRGICAAGTENLVFTGDGALTVQAGEDPISQGVFVSQSIYLESGTLTAGGGAAARNSCGIYSQGINLTEARLNAVGGSSEGASYGIWSDPKPYSDSGEEEPSWEGTRYETYSSLFNGIACSGFMIASGDTSAICLEENQGSPSAWFYTPEGCHVTGHSEPGDAGTVLRMHTSSYSKDKPAFNNETLRAYKTLSVQATGLEGINLTCGGAAFANGSWGNSFQTIQGEYKVKPDSRMWQHIGTSTPLFYEDQRYIVTYADDIPLTFYLSPTSQESTLHELVLYGSRPLDPALLSLKGAEMVRPFTMGSYGDNEKAMGPYGEETGKILNFYSCMLRIPQSPTSLGIFYDGVEVRTIPLYRDAEGTHEKIARRVTTFWVSDYRDDADGNLVSIDLVMTGFSLPTAPDSYLVCDRVWNSALNGGDGDYEYLPVAHCTALRADEAGRYTLTFEVTPEYTPAAKWVRADAPNLLVETASEWDSGETTYNGKKYSALGYYQYAVSGFSWVDLRTPFDCLYKEHPVRATADGTVTVSVNASVEDVGETVILATYDENGRMLGVNRETITKPGAVEVSVSADGAYKADAFQLSSELTPVEETKTCFLALAEEAES